MKISHVNHSSVILETDKTIVWTDPWVISPAFRVWTQEPYPFITDINYIAESKKPNKYILISHGHDDHLDDFVLSSLPFRDFTVVLPKLKSPGLKNRVVSTNRHRKVIEISTEFKEIGDLICANFINPEFTGDDTIFIIGDSCTAFIHANDNWHKYSPEFIERLQESLSFSKKNYYAVQLGIADPFPAAYNFTGQEIETIVRHRYKNYINAITENNSRLKSEVCLTYANQSRIPAFKNSCFYDKFKSDFFSQHKNVHQLTSGTVFDTSIGFDSASKATRNKNAKTILEKCLLDYEISAKTFIQTRNSFSSKHDFQFSIQEDSDLDRDNHRDQKIVFEAAPEVWADILIGNANIECITVGGCGRIKKPKELNISALHHLLCKWTYKQQSLIKTKKFTIYLGGEEGN